MSSRRMASLGDKALRIFSPPPGVGTPPRSPAAADWRTWLADAISEVRAARAQEQATRERAEAAERALDEAQARLRDEAGRSGDVEGRLARLGEALRSLHAAREVERRRAREEMHAMEDERDAALAEREGMLTALEGAQREREGALAALRSFRIDQAMQMEGIEQMVEEGAGAARRDAGRLAYDLRALDRAVAAAADAADAAGGRAGAVPELRRVLRRVAAQSGRAVATYALPGA